MCLNRMPATMIVTQRVPWTGVTYAEYPVSKEYDEVSYYVADEGEKLCILALGGFFGLGCKAAMLFQEKTGIKPTLINPRFITGLDEKTLDWVLTRHFLILRLLKRCFPVILFNIRFEIIFNYQILCLVFEMRQQ